MSMSPTVTSLGSEQTIFIYWLVFYGLKASFTSTGWGSTISEITFVLPKEYFGRSLSVIRVFRILGDISSRSLFGALLHYGWSWRYTLLSGGVIGALCTIPLMFTLNKSSPNSPVPKPLIPTKPPVNIFLTFRAMIKNAKFSYIAASFFGIAFIRNLISLWTSVFLHQIVKIAPGQALMMTLFVPINAMISSLAVGFLTDALSGKTRVLFLQILPVHFALNRFFFFLMPIPANRLF